MNEVVYAIKISHLEYSGLKIMDIKIGKSTNIDNTLRQYRRGNRDIELLDMWTPNPDKNLSTAERGVHEVAEKYAYDKQSEKFVFLQGAYQEFAETVNKLLKNASREEISDRPEQKRPAEIDDYTGKTPSVLKIFGETYDVDTWADTLSTAVTQILREADDHEPITEIKGRKRSYFVEEGQQSNLVKPRKISDTQLYLETNFSANDCVRIMERAMDTYGYDRTELEIFTEEA
ncbi:GIY-YIG nuclease family protein [Halobellus sp. GM3]|uniref:GIY-YIG nuclease family protein n=1 Tax=Halobellus sp. GM3 TaxID=3458410 RepID=UPI00403DBCC3